MTQRTAPEPGDAVEGALLWTPSDEQRANANLTRYMRWLGDSRGRSFSTYDDLWAWSVADLEGFWTSIWDFFGVGAAVPPTRALGSRSLPGAEWFPGARLNFAEHALRRRDDQVAILFKAEDAPIVGLTYRELAEQTRAVAAGLRRLGVGPGDRVVGFLPNIPETVIAFLATASIGAIWSCCSPEFGVASVVDRFRQIEPRVLIAADGYRYGGRLFDRREAVADLVQALPTLEHAVMVSRLGAAEGGSEAAAPDWRGSDFGTSWADLLAEGCELTFEQVPFDHPLWVLYSSGTTGLPKAIVHGHGGILLEQYKALSLHLDLGEADRFFWFTTSGWMMWNMLVSGLLVGSTIVLYDGSPAYPDMNALWRLAQEAGITYFGASAPYIQGCRKADIHPGRDFDLAALKGIGSTGAPLAPDGFAWVYDQVKRDVLLGSVSGGTDVCTAFVLSCPILPVRSGEIQCRGLGAKIESFDVRGHPVIGEVGELVVTEPLPSMPVSLWNDQHGERYRESYLDVFPGIWRHGDWLKITERGSCVIYGRSDSTLNRGGVRMGTSEFYAVVEEFSEIQDSLVVDTSELGVEGKLLLFVAPADGASLDDDLRRRISRALARDLSPRHVPDSTFAISAVPRTLNGKKMEVPVKRILAGASVDQVMSRDAMSNPDSLAIFIELARELKGDAPP